MFKKLRGKITEVFDTQKNFAAAMDMDYAVVNQRLSGTTQWKAPEIAKACDLLDIPLAEAHLYFFGQKLEKFTSLLKGGSNERSRHSKNID